MGYLRPENRTVDVDPRVHHYNIPHHLAEDGAITCICAQLSQSPTKGATK